VTVTPAGSAQRSATATGAPAGVVTATGWQIGDANS
jgi:hypothetical protein